MKLSAKILFRAILLAAIIVFAFYLANTAEENEHVQKLVADYGYAGIFIAAVVSGFNLIVPVPAVAFLPLFLASGLSFIPTIVLITLGVTIADIAAYLLGKAGHHVIHYSFEESALRKLERVRERYHWAPMTILFFFAAFAPLPNEVLLVPLGLLGYRLARIMPVVFAGNLVFNSLYATGTLGLFNLF